VPRPAMSARAGSPRREKCDIKCGASGRPMGRTQLNHPDVGGDTATRRIEVYPRYPLRRKGGSSR
jgi:hypothetical protein